jgi:ligand-binding sensor domain-containing protein/signal transduction histidine kinase
MKRLFLLAVLSLASTAFALVPGKDLTQYAHESWTVQHGLPGASVFSLVQTPDGFLWIRTSAGLVRFDGITFRQEVPIVEGHPLDEGVRAIARDLHGDLLVRSRTEVLVYRNQSFDRVLSSALPGGVDHIIYRDAAGRIWIGADNDLYLWGDKGFTKVIRGTGDINTLLDDGHGGVWIGASSGLFYYRDGKLTAHLAGANKSMFAPEIPWEEAPPPKEGLSLSSIENPSVLVFDHEGTLWIGGRHGLFALRHGVLAAEPSFASRQVTFVYEDRQHVLWVGTDTGGLFRRGAGTWSNFTHEDGLTENNVSSICEDAEGSLWVGTTGGLDRFKDTPVTPFTKAQGLWGEEVCDVVRSSDNAMFVFCGGAGVTEIRDGLVRGYGKDDGLEVNAADKMLAGRNGTMWLGTPNGIGRIKDGHATNFLADGRLNNVWISALGEDDEGLFLATGELKVHRFKDNQLFPFTVDGHDTPFSPRSTYFFTFLRDDDGVVWAGTTIGLDLPGSLYRIQRNPFSIRRIEVVDFSVTGIYDDHAGYLWLTGDTQGIVRYSKKDGRIVRFTKAQGLASDDINCAITDRHGDLWMGTMIGIVHVKRAELDAVAAGTATRVNARLFDMNDGMKSVETSSNRSQPGAAMAADGKLWFGTPKGVAIIDPDNILHNDIPPPVVLEKVVQDGVERSPAQTLVFRAGTERLEFQYNGLSLLVPTRVKFKYRLDGYDRDWIDAGTRRSAFYTRLPPGDYTFHVMACNNDGVWNETGAAVSFVLRPHFYQTTWFLVLCIAGVVGLFWVGHRIRLRQLTARQRLLEKLVEERTKSLADEITVRKAAEAETERIHKELLIASHRAGMAEMATAVLHNVGNTLNSVGVSVRLVMQAVQRSRASSLQRVADMLTENSGNMTEFLTTHPKGKLVPQFVVELAKELGAENAALGRELTTLNNHVEEMGKFVAMQQTYARVNGPTQAIGPKELVDEAIKANANATVRCGVRVVTDVQSTATINVEKPKALQILADLVHNAIDATAEARHLDQPVRVSVMQTDGMLSFRVTDHGIGIAAENLTKIFNSGFTTKTDGHGFSLHSGILAARQMGGDLTATSEGPGQGATFTLNLPLR